MRAVTIHGPGDIRVESVPDPQVQDVRDAVVRVSYACICGSDLWAYRGIVARHVGQRMGHEFIGIVEDVGPAVAGLSKGDRVVSAIHWSDGTCRYCQAGLYQHCVNGGFFSAPGTDGGQGEAVRVPFADGTLVRIPDSVPDSQLGVMASLCDVLPTGRYGAECANVQPGTSVLVLGDGAIGLSAVLACSRLQASRIVAFGHHANRLTLAARFGATDTVDPEEARRGGGPPAVIERLVGNDGVDAVIECVGTPESWLIAIQAARPGATIAYVGVPHQVKELPVKALYDRNITLRGGVAPVRRYIPGLLEDLVGGVFDPSPILDLEVSLDDVPAAYGTMANREAIKVLVNVANP